MQGLAFADSFAIRDVLRFEEASDGLIRAVVSTPAAEAEVYLQGAHLAHWKPHGQRPVLFLSPKSLLVRGKAIRGGVPIIFPWFGPKSGDEPGPDHGFARITEWALEGTKLHGDGNVEITLTLAANDSTREFGYADFHLRYRVTIGARLELELETSNFGRLLLEYEEALHTYLALSDVHRVSISGLEGTTYIDKTDGFQRKLTAGDPLRISAETDQVHLNTTATCIVDDPEWSRRIAVSKTGSHSTVIWNPWIHKTATMADMEPDSWKEMICVESANVADNPIRLAPGETQTMTVSISVE
jgi:glucose-6-phosphate 1-epimerase